MIKWYTNGLPSIRIAAFTFRCLWSQCFFNMHIRHIADSTKLKKKTIIVVDYFILSIPK